MINRTKYSVLMAVFAFTLSACGETDVPSTLAEDSDAQWMTCFNASNTEAPEPVIEICDDAVWAITGLQIEYPDAPEEQHSKAWFSQAFAQNTIASAYGEMTGNPFDVNACFYRDSVMDSLGHVSRIHVEPELYDPLYDITGAMVENCHFMLGEQ